MISEFVNLKQCGSDAVTAAARLAAWHYETGRKVLLVARDQAEAQRLDQALWTFDPASFVPHALAGGPDQQREPVLVATDLANPTGAPVVLVTHYRDDLPAAGLEKLILLLPVEDGPELEACRRVFRKMRTRPDMDVLHTTCLPG